MIITYKYRIKDRSAKKQLRRYAFAVNQVWNYCNAYQRDIEMRYRAGAPKRRWPTQFDLQTVTKGTSKDLGINSQTIQEVCRYYIRARDGVKHSVRFRSSTGPRRSLGWIPFRKRTCRILDNTITYLDKRFRWFGKDRRPLTEPIKDGVFVEDSSGKWWVCFHVEVDNDLITGNGEIGIDLGIKTLAALSDGQKIENLRHQQTWAQRLAKAQRARNKRRAKAIDAKIKNARHDHLHKISCRLARENALIAVGNVSSSRLAKTRMAKSVLDAGWASFKAMLSYKASRHSALFIEVDEKFTTQTCSSCGSLPPERPRGIAGLGIREWRCSDCGTHHDRDVNAARNILALALSAQRPVEGSRYAISDKHDARGCNPRRENADAA